MENEPDSTPAPLSPEEEKKEWSAFKKKIAALAITLTMMFSAGATIAANEKGVKSELENNDPTKINVGLHDIKTGPETIPGFGVSIPIGENSAVESSTEQKVIENEVQLMKYARLFDVDPAALEINGLDMIPGVADQIIALQANGFTINKISVTGGASDEALTKKKGSGLGRTDIENVRLADKRGHAGDDLLTESLTQKIGMAEAQKLAAITVVEKGIEVRDDAQAEAIDKMAESLNMTTVELIGKYNTHPETLSPEAREALDGLKSDRFVRFVIEASREVTDASGNKSTELVIIPILIPVFKRRKREPESGPDTDPITGQPRQPIVDRVPGGNIDIMSGGAIVSGRGYDRDGSSYRGLGPMIDITSGGIASRRGIASVGEIASFKPIAATTDLQPMDGITAVEGATDSGIAVTEPRVAELYPSPTLTELEYQEQPKNALFKEKSKVQQSQANYMATHRVQPRPFNNSQKPHMQGAGKKGVRNGRSRGGDKY